MLRHLTIFALSLCCSSVYAEIRLPAVISDRMVLQRDRQIQLWGWATPGKEVTVEFANEKNTGRANDDGTWLITLPPMQASSEERSITIREEGGATKTVNQVLVGEVWLASGQSNMEWNVKASRKEDIDAAVAKPLPQIRMLTVPKKVTYNRQDDVQASWSIATAEQVVNFSAVGYFFARNLHESLNVPVGILNSSWGGTRIDPWLAEEGFEGIEELAAYAKERASTIPGNPACDQAMAKHIEATRAWCDAAAAAIKSGSAPTAQPAAPALLPLQSHTGMYQAMIHPLRNYALRGFIWYQGESNNGEGMLYYHKMRTLIAGWRKQFSNENAPFYFVQLAPFQYNRGNLAEIWAAQQKSLSIPHTGMAVINDIGNIRDIHPGNKSEVGRRLALWAFHHDYSMPQKVFSGPLYRKYTISGDSIRVEFDHIGSGLKTRDGNAPNLFEIAGDDGKFHPATATIAADKKSVSVKSDQVPKPIMVRFAWSEIAEPNLMNEEGLPTGAFHSHWPDDPTLGACVTRDKPFTSSHVNEYGWNTGLTDGVYGEAAPHAYATSQAPQFPKHVTIDLGEEKEIMLLRCGVPKVGSTKTVALSISTDGKAFTESVRLTFEPKKASVQSHRMAPTKTRFVRATFLEQHAKQDNYDRNFGFLSELEAFAPKSN